MGASASGGEGAPGRKGGGSRATRRSEGNGGACAGLVGSRLTLLEAARRARLVCVASAGTSAPQIRIRHKALAFSGEAVPIGAGLRRRQAGCRPPFANSANPPTTPFPRARLHTKSQAPSRALFACIPPSPQAVPLTGIAITGVGVAWGVHDLTAGTMRLVLPAVAPADRSFGLGAAKATWCAASAAGVVFLREVVIGPRIRKLSPLPWAEASALQTVALAWRSMERVVRYFPYRHRLVTVVLCGAATGFTSVVVDYRWLAAHIKSEHSAHQQAVSEAAAAAAALSAGSSADKKGAKPEGDERSVSRFVRDRVASTGRVMLAELKEQWMQWQDAPPSQAAVTGESGMQSETPTHVLGSLPGGASAGPAEPSVAPMTDPWATLPADAVRTAFDSISEAEAEASAAAEAAGVDQRA